ncbi:hypothetical protein BUALT_Bualt12G0132100 [Buddleja alternifolia]|uniref:Imidazoleglycerol-phosphate dehydratase n=1 Tax=Buddleja alternifolia TaxID=168488 RepID=A0AAV6WY73_9LAMI|nr:hypothetical protein BUALT_Bualt12G0132100 [Buddleja alternifolia]
MIYICVCILYSSVHPPPSTTNRRRLHRASTQFPPCMDLSLPHSSLNYSFQTLSPSNRSQIHLSHRIFLPVHLHRRNVHLFSTQLEATPMDSKILSAVDNNDCSSIRTAEGGRIGEVKRITKETNVKVKINLDGNANAENDTGIPFLDHMLDQLASHGLFDVHVKATGDIHIDDHHTNEDVALAIGTALLQALGDRKGINRFGDFSAPLDEALIHVSLDLSGRPHLSYDLRIPTERVGTFDTQLVEHFFQSLVNTSGMTLHIRQLAGRNSHHIIEATFKAFARALRQATEYDPRRRGSVPSSKGVLSRS